MAKFLTTSGITYHIENMMKEAREKLILISPFLKLNERLRQILDDKDREKIDIRVVYGKNDLQPEENNWLKSKASIRSSFCKNLHAKCYLNENEALITSMNLYEFSQVNNEEMGILFVKAKEPDFYVQIYDEAMRLIRISDEVRVTVEKIQPAEVHFEPAGRRSSKLKSSPPEVGYCIRCRAAQNPDPTHPFCKDCFGKWKQYEKPDYEEKFCHLCGKSTKSSMRKPSCYDCYKAFKDVMTFPNG
jgi:phosphatidylserine/phosphatidylglycerophosphate/cardiolipin synthase-like enzyme